MSLTGKQKHYLRGLAHNRNPIVIIGNAGLTKNVVSEIDQALTHHELIKVRIRSGDREQRQEIIASICDQAACEEVQRIGQIAVLFREGTPPTIKLP